MQRERETGRANLPICWFTPQIVAMAGVGAGQSHQLGILSEVSYLGNLGASFGTLAAAFSGTSVERWVGSGSSQD